MGDGKKARMKVERMISKKVKECEDEISTEAYLFIIIWGLYMLAIEGFCYPLVSLAIGILGSCFLTLVGVKLVKKEELKK